jgi:NAD(P)H-dependent flavin oxidoreductase YrpB (nitropropane dioxygenase family)
VPLEAAGIATFLHVPSPGLLDRFLAEGARRFVFEGRECGGHIGPQASFPLWESQLQRLLRYDDAHGCAGQLHVLFAGGIHDERSAAMVTALAAPLLERGARIGMLMGTAYLFTEEAVTAGAIRPEFQRAALGCERTVLLETAPGHSTRCADSPYQRTFTETRSRLVAAGVPRDQMWAELEELNLGRLRIASKGLRRDGDTLVAVDEEVQHEDGMVMLGEVATLRSATTTIEALHTQVTEGAAGFLTARAAELGIGPIRNRQLAQTPQTPPLDVAIVGMAAVFPGADDVAGYWANVLAGVDAVTEVPPERWDPAVYGETAKWGGFLPNIPFDALSYRSGQRVRVPFALPGLPREATARAGRATTDADRGFLPRRAGQCDRRSDRQPLGPRRRQLHGGRRLRLLAGRHRPGLQGTASRHQCDGARRWRRRAQQHQRLFDVRLGTRALTDRPMPPV